MESLFLGLFVFGLAFLVLSFALGFGHAHLHLPAHLHLSAGHGPGGGDPRAGGELSPINVSTMMTFLTWFGGVGYILGTLGTLGTLIVFALSTLAGFFGAAIVFLLLVRYLLPGQTAPMRPEDYRIEGTLGRVSLPIGGGRTGEVQYAKGGAIRSEGARSADGEPLPRGAEVVILRYERGIAYVQPLDRLLSERGARPPALGEERPPP